MPSFLLETYLPTARRRAVSDLAVRAADAARAMTGAGVPVRHLRTIYVPEDETCYHLFEAATAEAVRQAARRAGLLEAAARGVVKPSYDVAAPGPGRAHDP